MTLFKIINYSLIIIATYVIFLSSTVSNAQSKTTYSVYCANDRIEVDMRTFEQMKSARGSSVCKLGEFDYLSDAQSFAKKNFGGTGATCSCK